MMAMRKWMVIAVLLVCALPVFAQATDTVTYNGIGFEYDTSLAGGVQVLNVSAEDPALEQPGGPVPGHIAFTLLAGAPDPLAETSVERGTLRVFNTADFEAYPQFTAQFASLQGILETRPDLGTYTQTDINGDPAFNLPYLPAIGPTQFLRAKPQYIETESVAGVRYLTAFVSDVSPLTSDRILYTFQGVSTDGARYVSLIVLLDSSVLPAEVPADFNEDDFLANFESYQQETATLLNEAAVESFAPSPLVLDALVQSITLPAGGGAGEGESVGGGTAGALEGSWTLVSYGDPAQPTPVIPEAPITLTFTPDGIGGDGGCNSYFGGFSFNNGVLDFGTIGSTLIACDESRMQQEMAYYAALDAATAYTLDGDTLTITYGGEGEVAPGALVFTRASE